MPQHNCSLLVANSPILFDKNSEFDYTKRQRQLLNWKLNENIVKKYYNIKYFKCINQKKTKKLMIYLFCFILLYHFISLYIILYHF